jgi:hypothetical protein
MLTRPDSSEYAEFYKNYISRVPEGSVLDFMTKQIEDHRQFLRGVSEEAAATAPAPGEWSVKQVLGHLCDTERVMTYRALRFARGDQKELQGFEQDDYAREAHSNSRSVEDLLNDRRSLQLLAARSRAARRSCQRQPGHRPGAGLYRGRSRPTPPRVVEVPLRTQRTSYVIAATGNARDLE